MSSSSAAQQTSHEASFRRLHALVRTINGDLDLDRTLEAVANGIVEGLGFQVTVINLVQDDGDFLVVAVAGSDEARRTLLGRRGVRESWERWMALCEPVGALLVDYRRVIEDDEVPTWVPDTPVSDDEDAWHPLDAVVAPLRTSRSGLLGTLSVDLPLDGRRPTPEQLELLEMYAAQASVAIENAALHTALVARDVEREEAVARLVAMEGELRHAAFHDPLTGLANRALLRERLDRVPARADVSLLLLDLDGFKAVNDSLGHEVGDQVLLEVSRRLTRSCRPTDLLVRLGGDEFVALVEGTQDRAIALAERFLAILTEPISVAERNVVLGGSIGIASPTDDSADGALRDADIAMYVAKSRGKGRYQVFEPQLRAVVMDRAALSEELRTAVSGGQLALRYHPVIDVHSREIVAFEALLRWNHPTRGELSPLLFVPLAEETGAIHEIGDWVLREACAEMRRIQDLLPADRDMTVSVNLSAVQLHSPDLVDKVEGVLADAGLEPRRLVLELTESVLVEDVAEAVRILGRLRTSGVRLAMDDFGAGYSSLRYLKRLPFDFVKLDKGLLDGVESDPAALALLDAVLSLLNRLGLRTCAEGIETAAQLAVVGSLGCELGQGFLVCQPLRPAELHTLLLNGWDAPRLPTPRDGQPLTVAAPR